MSTRNVRSSSNASSSSLTKRPGGAMENAAAKATMGPLPQQKKRVALGNITNQSKVSYVSVPSKKKGSSVTHVSESGSRQQFSISIPTVKHSAPISQKNTGHQNGQNISTDLLRSEHDKAAAGIFPHTQPASEQFSPKPSSEDGSVSLNESMSTCDSFKSPDIEYIDNSNASAVASLERKTSQNLCISEDSGEKEAWKREILVGRDVDDKFINIDGNHKDPQQCTRIASDIYNHLRISETKKRPSTDFMEKVQKDINPSMRAILVDWLVEVAEEYRLVPDTLYLTVNYIDRYLSGNVMNRQQLQLLGVACMLIASKYEEICAPQVEEFCYITDNTYLKDEVLQMESSVLNFLKFEMTAPTVKCFLRRFVQAAQAGNEARSLHLEFLTSYVAELSLLEYSFLAYPPSLIAASAIFLANFILQPSKRPWNATLQHYTLYKPSELRTCVKALQHLICNNHCNSLPAIKEKYSQHKYKFVAKKFCPPIVPLEFFHDV